MKTLITPTMLYFGTPVVVISSSNADGTTNIAPMSSAWWVGHTAMLGMSGASQTVRNLLERPRCVLNLVDGGGVDAIDRMALLTGRADVPARKVARGYSHEADKFAATGLTRAPSDDGGPDGVAECPVHLGGHVVASHPIDGEGSELCAIEVRVDTVRVEEALVVRHDGHDHLDALAWDPLVMKFCEYFSGGRPLRESSLARGWRMPPLGAPAP